VHGVHIESIGIPAMTEDASHYTRLILFSTLAVTVVGAAYVQYDAQKMKRALKSQADMLVNEFTAESTGGAIDAIATVTATRKYVLFGEPRAKITVYLRNNRFEEHSAEANDEKKARHLHSKKYSGVEYLFSKQEDEWLNTESGQCSEERCQVNAELAFESTGI
jgi:hypothetical protein